MEGDTLLPLGHLVKVGKIPRKRPSPKNPGKPPFEENSKASK